MGNVILFSELVTSRQRIAETRELLAVAQMLERGEPVPEELAARHDLNEISRWIAETQDDL